MKRGKIALVLFFFLNIYYFFKIIIYMIERINEVSVIVMLIYVNQRRF